MAVRESIPEEIKQYRPCKCARIRKLKGVYRVYKYNAVKLDSGKWSSSTGYLIGKIVPGEGFIPNKRYQAELDSQKKDSNNREELTDLSYGKYGLLMSLSEDVLEDLKACFSIERAYQIYCYALILCANGFLHIDQINEHYLESIMSLKYKDFAFKMGYTALGNLLHDLGCKTNPVREFQQRMIDKSSKNIAIDGHVIRSCSEDNCLAEAGYKTKQLKAPQVNVLIAYDSKRNVPLMYRTYRGSSVDKSSCVEFLKGAKFKDTKFVVDCGFYSKAILNEMSKNGNCYTIPLPQSNSNFKRIKKDLQYTSGEFVYKSGKKDSARIVYYEEKISDTKRVIFFKDMDENNSKRKSYRSLMALEEPGYTKEGYESYCDWWGVYPLETTSSESAEQVFCNFKRRWSIETYNNYIKNDADFNNLKIQDYCVQHGFDFIMLVTGILHSKLLDAVKSLNRPDISLSDILTKAGHLRMVKEVDENTWYLHNARTKDTELLRKMGFDPKTTLT